MFVIPRRALGLLVLVSLFAGANAFALTVNDSTDTHHTNTGECALTGSGTCGLYDVFTYANAHPAGQPYTITFSVASVNVQAGLPSIQVPMTIGPAATPRVQLIGNPSASGLVVASMLSFGAVNPGDGTTIQNLVIRDFNSDGIAIVDGGNLVVSCYIGTDINGTVAHPNQGYGVSITTTANGAFPPPWDTNAARPYNRLGDSNDATQGNLISGNTKYGVNIHAEGTVKNVVTNNLIGTDITGTSAIPNQMGGVLIDGNAFDNTIGPGNVISGNNATATSDGIYLSNAVLYQNHVIANTIGPSKDFLTNLGNGEDGIHVDSTKVDPSAPMIADIVQNTVGYNAENGIIITGSGGNASIAGNSVGVIGSTDIGNVKDGIRLTTGGHQVGGAGSSRNVISANHMSGISMTAGATDCIIIHNIIGRDAGNTVPFGNTLDGITLIDAGNNRIGSTNSPTLANTITNNGRNGIKVTSSGNGWANNITGNSIFGNHTLVPGLGIDLDYAPEAPDPTDNSTPGQDPNANYANFGQNAPVITNAVPNGGTTNVTWTLDTAPSVAVRLEFFSNDAAGSAGNGEGQTYLFNKIVVTDGAGHFGETTQVPVPPGQYVSMTANPQNPVDPPGPTNSGPANNTSEFSNAFLVPDPITHLDVTAISPQMAGQAFSFTVTARTASNAVGTTYTGTVHFTSSDGQAVLPGDYTFTGGDSGTHVFTNGATLKTAGMQSLTATDTGDATINGTANIQVDPGPATHYAVSAPATATAGSSFSFTVTAQDQFNNTATTYGGTVHFTSSDLQAVLPANSTLSNGVGTLSATLKTSGLQSITATDTVTASITGTTSVLVNSSAPSHLTVSGPATTTAGAAFSFTVTALDQFNNTATGYTGTVQFTTTDPGVGVVVPANYTFVGGDNGVHTFTNGATLVTAGPRTITATDTVTASITGTSGTITVNAAAATHFSVSAPASATAGSAFSFTVTALDQFNNTATSYAGTVHFSSTDGQAVLPANSVLSSGVQTFSATLKTAGNQTITGTDNVTMSITGTSNTISVSAAAATHYAVSAPASATANSSFSFTVTAQDVFNNTATSYAGTVHFTSSDVQAVLPANSTLTSGTGVFSATLKTAGGQTITATDTVTASITGTSGSINVTATAAINRADFDGDGKSDITLRSTNGSVNVLSMNGLAILFNREVDSAAPAYQIAGTGDFNADGKADILLQDTNNNLGLWFMTSGPNGAQILGGHFVGLMPAGYSVVGVGDFNNDGKMDILLRNSNGLGIWFNGDTTVTGAFVGSLAGNYSVAGVGDFDGDNKADILLQDTNGGLGIWFMNGASLTSGAFVANPGIAYSVAGVADFDGDGRADILLRNTNGDLRMWLMNGSSIIGHGLVGTPGTNHVVVNVNDYDGDHRADILLLDNTGAITMWLMNGLAISNSGAVLSPGTGYTVRWDKLSGKE